jgi:hypothetical protein
VVWSGRRWASTWTMTSHRSRRDCEAEGRMVTEIKGCKSPSIRDKSRGSSIVQAWNKWHVNTIYSIGGSITSELWRSQMFQLWPDIASCAVILHASVSLLSFLALVRCLEGFAQLALPLPTLRGTLQLPGGSIRVDYRSCRYTTV